MKQHQFRGSCSSLSIFSSAASSVLGGAVRQARKQCLEVKNLSGLGPVFELYLCAMNRKCLFEHEQLPSVSAATAWKEESRGFPP